ncbi:MAG: hypothetical protein V1835_02030 [Candidatus Micrarchaeota archaeon]
MGTWRFLRNLFVIGGIITFIADVKNDNFPPKNYIELPKPGAMQKYEPQKRKPAFTDPGEKQKNGITNVEDWKKRNKKEFEEWKGKRERERR